MRKDAFQTEVRESLLGKPCWYASCGAAVGSSFQLAFGERLPRRRALSNPNHSVDYRENEGEANLLVWCTWRLDGVNTPITSSDDDDDERLTTSIEQLVGQTATKVNIELPGMDLHVEFNNGSKLHVFCDRMTGESGSESNWELWMQKKVHVVELGCIVSEEARS